MRIEKLDKSAFIQGENTKISKTQNFSNLSTIASLSTPSWLTSTLKGLWEKITYYFKKLFPCFFKVNAKVLNIPGSNKPPIEYFKVEDKEGFVIYRICKNEVPTENEIGFVRSDKELSITLLSFPDKVMQDYIKPMLKEIMDNEKTMAIKTKNLGIALKLFDAGLVTTSKVSYEKDKKVFLETVFEAAVNHQNDFSDEGKAAFKRVMAIINPKENANLISQGWQILGESIYGAVDTYEVPMKDILLLLKEPLQLNMAHAKAQHIKEKIVFNLSDLEADFTKID